MKSKKTTNRDNLEAVATFELPPALQAKLKQVRHAIDELKTEAAQWGVERQFTPDGRFLGDIGELIAKLFFGVTLNIKQEKGHDATDAEADGEATVAGRKVEVKLRSRSTLINFSTIPEIALVIYVSPTTLKWGVVCNGPGEMLLETAKKLADGKYSTDCFKLLKAQSSASTEDRKLALVEPKVPAA